MKKKLPYLRLQFYVTFLLILLTGICPGQSNTGTDFWFGFLGDNDQPNSNNGYGYAVNITSFFNTTGTFTIPAEGYSVPFTVTPGAVTRFLIPNTDVDFDGEGIMNQACHITSVLPIAPYYSEESGGPRDGNTYLLPDTLLGNDYYVMSYTLTNSADESDPSEFIVTAPGDTVNLVITPTALTFGGHAANAPYNITLDPGQVYQVKGANYGDLTGTHITAANPSDPTQKFSVISGSDIAGAGCANTVDGMFNELIPTYTWGKSYIFVSTEWVDDLCRVLASTNNTQVSINGTLVATLNAGQYYQTSVTSGAPVYITSNNPISVGRIQQDQSCNNYTVYAEGDADLSILMPNEDMYIDSVTYYCNLINGVERNFLQIMSRTSDISTYKLDGVPIPSANFHPLAYNPAYSYDTMEVTTAGGNGSNHELTTTGCGFVAYCSGLGDVASYSSAIGLYLRNLVNLTSGVASATSTPASCSGCIGTATATVAGGLSPYDYSWSDANSQTTSTATGLCSGTYTVVVQERCDISNDTAIVVVGGNGSSIAIKATPDTVCAGSPTTISVPDGGAGTTYQWSNNATTSSITVNPTTTTTYSVAISNSGCPPLDTNITVTVNPLPDITISPDDTSICVSGGIATLNASGAVSYAWSPAGGLSCTNCSNPTASPSVTTLYEVTGTDAHGCVSSAAATVNVITTPPTITLVAEPKVLCQGSTAIIQATALNAVTPITWQPGSLTGPSITVTPASTTIYTASASSTCGTASDTVTITVNSLPVPSFSSDVTAGCSPLCVQFEDQSTTSSGKIIQWAWTFGNGDSSHVENPVYCYPKAGNYSVGLTTLLNTGCSASLNMVNYITVYGSPATSFTTLPQPATIVSPTVQFINHTTDPYGIIQWWWTFGDQTDSVSTQQNAVHTYQDTGTYCATLVATDANGCVDTATDCLVIEPVFVLYIPSAFTPNGDGKNDIFTAKGNDVQSFEMYIFDRWGVQLFHTTDINNGWNGNINNTGAACQEDTYVYKIIATNSKDKEYSYVGSVTLIR